MAKDEAGTFARDLGYLQAFLEKLGAHAATLPPAARARLEALVAEERPRWTAIGALLSGRAAASPAVAPPAASRPRPALAQVEAKALQPAAGVRNGSGRGFTVGSLRGGEK